MAHTSACEAFTLTGPPAAVGDVLPLLLVASVALAGGIVLGLWAGRQKQAAENATRQSENERALATAAERAAALDRQNADTANRLRAAEDAHAATRSALEETRARIAQLETTLQHERRAAEEKIALLADAHAKLTGEFKSLSADALKSNSTAFLELARETFGKLQQYSAGELEKRQQAIDSLVKPLKESLEKVDAKIGEIEKTRAGAYSQLSEQLKNLGTAQSSLQAETTRLNTALRSTTTAGRWGEVQLHRVVELAGMVQYCDFFEQETVGTAQNRLRPDMTVRLPGGGTIVVDSKAPLQAYLEAAAATDEATRNARLAEHARQVRSHIDALADRAYWSQFERAPEVVVLFLPGEAFYYGAFQADPSVIEYGSERRVLLATPVSLIALLRAAAYGWRQEDVSKNAQLIAEIGRQLYDRIATFADNLEKAGRNLETAVRGYNAAIGSFEQTLVPGARRFAELGAKGSKELTEPSTIESTPREITKRG